MGGSANEGGFGYVGFVWEDGRMTRLETPEAMLTMPAKINEKGQILGTGRVVGSSRQHVLLWDAGKVTDLGEGWAIALNDRGQAVFGRMDTPGSPQLWYLWEEDRLTRIKGVDGPDLRATDLNNNGIVAGYVEDADRGTQRAATWQSGTLTFLDLKAKDSQATAQRRRHGRGLAAAVGGGSKAYDLGPVDGAEHHGPGLARKPRAIMTSQP